MAQLDQWVKKVILEGMVMMDFLDDQVLRENQVYLEKMEPQD